MRNYFTPCCGKSRKILAVAGNIVWVLPVWQVTKIALLNHMWRGKRKKVVGNLRMDEPLWLKKSYVPVHKSIISEQRFLTCKSSQLSLWEPQSQQYVIWCLRSFVSFIGRPEHAHARRWCSPHSPHTGTSPGRPAPRGQSKMLSPSPWKTNLESTTVPQTTRCDKRSCWGRLTFKSCNAIEICVGKADEKLPLV